MTSLSSSFIEGKKARRRLLENEKINRRKRNKR
jgi:hypothetical protein